jgi:hypothetical protein
MTLSRRGEEMRNSIEPRGETPIAAAYFGGGDAIE